MLKRSKQQSINGNLLLDLPSKTIIPTLINFTEEEQDFYDSLYQRSEMKFNSYVKGTEISLKILIYLNLLLISIYRKWK